MFLLFEFFDKVRKTTGFRGNHQEKHPKKFPGRGVLPPLIKIDVGIAHAGGYTPAHIPWLAGPVSVPGSIPPPYGFPHTQYIRAWRKLQGGRGVCNTVVTLGDVPVPGGGFHMGGKGGESCTPPCNGREIFHCAPRGASFSPVSPHRRCGGPKRTGAEKKEARGPLFPVTAAALRCDRR